MLGLLFALLIAAGLLYPLGASISRSGGFAGPATLDAVEEDELLEAGLRALREGRSPLAVTLLRASAGEAGDLAPQAWLGLGVAYARLERMDAAHDALDRALVGQGPVLAGWIRYLQADLLLESGRSAEADSVLDLAGEVLPSGPIGSRIRSLRLELGRRAGGHG